MAHSSNFNVTLSLGSNVYNTVQVHINGRPLEMTSEGFVTFRGDHRANTFVIRADRRPHRHPVPYPVHAHVLSSQQREAERRRAAMTPSSSGTSYVPQAREVRLASICATRPIEILRPNPDDLTQVRDASADDDSLDSCVICLSRYESEQKVRILLCNHKFHKKCIDEWFNILLNCPICRMGIDGNPHEEEERPVIAFTSDSSDENEENDSIISVYNSSPDEQDIIVID